LFWDRNFFAESVPLLGGVLKTGFVRGAVSGFGAVCVGAGLAELVAVVGRRGRA